MRFIATALAGVFLIELEPHTDERGFFTRLYDPEAFVSAGIDFAPVQVSLSHNVRPHTMRGLHYQDPPHAEAKLVQVVRGGLYDVVVDARRNSPTYGRWAAFTLDLSVRRAVYIPQGCAHGFLTLAAETDVLYHIDKAYVPGHANGYRWNDPRLAIAWPAEPKVMAQADREWPDFPMPG